MAEISLDILIEKAKEYLKEPDLELLRRAYEFAAKIHANQKRKSGEDYITHPLRVALILAELHQDSTVIAASFLHDVIEDQSVPLQTLKKEFGSDIANLVDGVTKLSKFSFSTKEEQQAENLRKMFIAMAKDVRVVIIKLADRLHNMRTLQYLSPERQKSISLETREIYAPLAHRLGIGSIKWELDDLAFRYLEPAAFQDIKNRIAEKRQDREKYVHNFIKELKDLLAEHNIKAEVYGRPKHFYSIYRKMQNQHISFEALYDLLAIRILVIEMKDCYEVLGTIHAQWKPIQHKFADYIAMPKSNMYQSLHTGIIGPAGKPIEVQIRTYEMHRIAEYGIAAHWQYKIGEKLTEKKAIEKFAWIRQLLDWQQEDAKTFMENLKVDLFTDEVFVFTPKGAVFNLPARSSPVDFAYHVHTQVGHRCIGAKINGKMEPLDYQLKNGDIVEIVTSKKDRPSLDWLNFIVTTGARNKIKNWFHRQQKTENIKRGQEALEKTAYSLLLSSSILTNENLEKVAKRFGLLGIDELYMSIGHGELSALLAGRTLKEIVEKKPAPTDEVLLEKKGAPAKSKTITHGVSVVGVRDILIRLAKCCTPLPGDEIVGIVTKGHGISIHRFNCPNVQNRADLKQVAVEWDKHNTTTYPVEIEVKAFDRVGIIKDILNQIAEAKTNLKEASVKTKIAGVATSRLVVEIRDLKHLTDIMNLIRNNIADVFEVYRPKPI
ncbi:RelA/SpoT family protein [Candidatus Margulisiibacteriota bacterium]